ncbi:MAG: Na-translocating system protein MpsC family protein [Bacillota bacterium]|nr:Na-translocating system protein MpsC family protein [Bacillota bacterium]
MNNEILSGLNVLYIEDEPVLREEITTFLKRRVKSVIVASNGKEGLEKFATYPVDFIITDLKMPVMDGIEMAREIRKSNTAIPIVITTALSDVELMQSSIEIGINRYLLKPIDLETFNNMLESVCQKISNNRKNMVFSLTVEESKNLERRIETEIAKILKATTGKGPSKVQGFLRANLIEIVIHGARTPFEQTILSNDKNVRIGDYVREVYYAQLKNKIQDSIFEISGYKAIWQTHKCDSTRDVDIIKMLLEIE